MARKQMDWKLLGTLLLMFAAAVFFWNWKFLYPIKAFVVLLHELGHGLAAIATGGEIAKIELSSNLGGVCWSRGGSRIVVLSSGYLGSMLFGGVILVAAARTRFDRFISMGIGGVVILVTALFVRTGFGIAFGLLFGAAMIVMGKFLSEKINDLLLKFLGLTSCMYAIIDIKEDLISRTVPSSDASAMSRELGLPSLFWGVLWITIAVVVSGFLVFVAARTTAEDASTTKAAPRKLS